MAAKHSENVLDKEDVGTKHIGLNCPICLEIYQEPKSLTCLHTFCKLCIQLHVIKMKENGTLMAGIECPLCRKVTVVENSETQPEEWTKQLPPNYALVGAIQTVHRDEKESGAKLLTKCQPCLKKNISVKASMFCANCPDYLCSECAEMHVLFVNSQGHKLIKNENIENAFDHQTDLILSMTKLDRCDTHSKQIKFYCADDKKLCCSSCAIISHRPCKSVIEIDKVANEETQTSETVKSELVSIKDKLKTTANMYLENEKGMDAHVLEVKNTIQNIRGQLKRVVDEFEKKILNETLTTQKQKSAELNVGRLQCESLIAALEGSLRMHEAVVQHGSASQKCIAMHKLEEQCKSYAKATEEPLSNLQSVEISLELEGHTKKVLDSALEIGKLHIKSSKPYATVKEYQKDLDFVKNAELSNIYLDFTDEELDDMI